MSCRRRIIALYPSLLLGVGRPWLTLPISKRPHRCSCAVMVLLLQQSTATGLCQNSESVLCCLSVAASLIQHRKLLLLPLHIALYTALCFKRLFLFEGRKAVKSTRKQSKKITKRPHHTPAAPRKSVIFTHTHHPVSSAAVAGKTSAHHYLRLLCERLLQRWAESLPV